MFSMLIRTNSVLQCVTYRFARLKTKKTELLVWSPMPPGVGIRVRASGSLVKGGQSASHCGEETKRGVFME